MDATLPVIRDRLIQSLQAIEKETERLFLSLGESLPALVEEMQASVAMSRNALGCLDGGVDADGCGEGEAIRRLADEMSSDILASGQTVEDVVRRDDELFEQLQQGINQLSEIETAIGRIRSDSEEMELVSLNAMTVALKAGNAGRAFSYITEELRRLAGRTISITEEITGRGESLLERFRRLEELLRESRSLQQRLLKTFQTRLNEALDDFRGGIGALVDAMRDLQVRSTRLEGPVTRLMEAIQLQDLIRQSIDHIVLSLQSFEPARASMPTDRALDELAFMRRVPTLARALVDDVADQIHHSAETFRAATADADSRLAALERERRELTDGTVVRGDHTIDLEETLRHASETLQLLIDDLGSNMRHKDQLFARSTEITTEVEQLDLQFRRFYPLVQRFHSIDVASRIEVAKQDVLRSMGTRTDRMTELTAGIERDVESAILSTQRFITSTSSAISDHGSANQRDVAFFEAFAERIERYRVRLSQSHAAVIDTVHSFSLFTEGFFEVFKRSRRSGEELDALASSIASINEELERMNDIIERRFRAALEERELDDWTINNERLRQIIDRFTIFTHKQHAGELVGLTVESGVEAGEVTLF